MKTKKILFGSTLLAAAALNFCAASANADTYTWAGTGESASWDTETANWTTDGGTTTTDWVNSTSNDATFTGDAESKKVSIEEAISAHTVEITGGSYTFTLGESGSLSANAFLKVDDNASLTVDGKGSVKFTSNATIGKSASLTISGGSFSVNGTVTVNEGGSIEITDGDVLFNYTATINSDATLKISGGSLTTNYTTTVDGGSIEVTDGDALFKYTVAVSSGGTIEISGGDTTFSKAVTVDGEGSSIEISDGSVSFNGDVTIGDGASIDISGGSVSFNGDVTIGDGSSIDISGGSVVFNGSIDLSEGGSINLTDATMIYYNYTIEAQSKKTPSGGDLNNYDGFEGIGVMVGGTVTDFELTGSDGNAISGSNNIYITGTSEDGSDKLTITSINIAESEKAYNNGLEAFIVENATVIFDGGVTESGGTTTINTGSLGLTLIVGTLSDATLEITNGASVTFNGIWNTLGSNLHTGTINISGEGSYLCTQQISIGMVYVSLSGGASITDGYYFAQYLESDSERDAVVKAVTSGTYEGSYGIINVTDGGTYAVGVGNTDPSNNRLQLSNGEINIDGTGSSMILGSNSSIFMMGENGLYVTDEGDETGDTMHIATGVYYTEKIIVTNGGSVVNENDTSLRQAIFGDSFYAANTTVVVSVDGAGSTFDIAVGNDNAQNTYDYALFGSVYGYYKDFEGALNGNGDTYLGDGGSADVSISASDGGTFKVSAQEGIYAALDNAADYFTKDGDYKGAPPSGQTAGHSYGINVEFAATTGGTIELEATNGSDVVLAAGYAADSYENSVIVKADGTSEDSETASSVTISGANIYANAHDASNVYVSITATNGGEITLSASGIEPESAKPLDATGETGIILFNQNTSVFVGSGSSLTLSGAVNFSAGSSLTVNAGGTWTSTGSISVAEGATMDLNGTIDLSNQIQNSGEITVGSNVAFVVNESLKVEDTYFTYTFITNTEAEEPEVTPAGSIVNWDDLTAGNFVIDKDLYNLADDIGVVLKADGQATIVFITEDESGGTATVDYDYSIGYKRNNWESYSFYCIGIEVDGTVGSFTLQDLTNESGEYAITSKDVLFIGSGATDGDGNLVDSVTITEANISNGTYTSGTTSTTKVFAVEGCTVIIDNVEISELGMNLTVGTMYGAGDAELVITNKSKVTTGAFYNDVGANLATGTITISENSTLATQQITLGCGVNSLFACSSTNAGDYWTKYIETQDEFEDARDSLFTEGYTGSYGIVNVESGSTFSVGVGNTDHSNNKFQLSNGELNISGAGSQMIIGQNSCFYLMGEQGFSATDGDYSVMTGMYLTEKITVTDGGKIVAETDEYGNSATLTQVAIGDSWLASNTTVEILVSGKDDSGNASTFDLTSDTSENYDTVLIGTSSGYDSTYGNGKMDGGTTSVTITASDEGVFRLGAAEGFYVCADNYAAYGDAITENDVGHSDGINVKLSAESGGSITLDAMYGSTVLLAAGSPTDGNENTLTITADGTLTNDDGTTTASSITISGGDIYTNYGDAGEGSDNVYVTITATNGGTIALSAATVDDKGNGVISFGMNTAVSVDASSSLMLSGAVTLAAGATMDFAGTETISDTLDSQGAITVSDGTLDVKSISVTKDATGGETDGVLTISGGKTTVETLTIGDETESLGGTLSITGGTLDVDTLSIAGTASVSMTGGTLNVSGAGTFSIASYASASFSGGTVNVSTAIANDGSVTVNGDVVFVLNDSLKVEGTSATYAIIINGESGTITGWQTLGTDNFVYGDLSALATNVVLDLTTDGYVTLLYTEGGVTINYDYEVPWLRGAHSEIGLEGDASDGELYYFRAMHIEIDEGASVGGFTLQDLTNEDGGYAISGKNVYITGKADEEGNYSSKLTITSAKIYNGEAKNSYDTQDSFIVEGCTVVFDGEGINIAELGMNLSIGTKTDAELVITNGAQVRTGAYLNTVGANLATGTITISGEGSLLDNQQITLGAATNSEFGIPSTSAKDGTYWIQFVETEDEFQDVINKIASDEYDPTKDGSYGIVNVLDGATWQVGVGNPDSSISRIQLSNGEINIDGGSVILGNSSGLAITGENMVVIQEGETYTYATGVNYSQSITITNGGSLSAYEDGTIHNLTIGQIWYASNDTVSISVDGEDSSFVVKTSDSTATVPIGYNKGTWSGGTYTDGYGNDHTIDTVTIDGGSEKIDITASNGGVISITAASSIAVAYDNPDGDTHSYGIDVSISAESGGSITLAVSDVSKSGNLISFGHGSAATADANSDGENDYQNSVSVKATGEGSSVDISAYTIYSNYLAGNVVTEFGAYDGASLSMSATSQLAFGLEGSSDKSGTSIGSSTVTADGAGSTVTLYSGTYILTNWYTAETFTSNFVASNGGSLSLETSASGTIYFGYNTAGGDTNIKATGEGSKLSISAGNVCFGCATGGGSITVTATGSGSVVEISGSTIYVNYQTSSSFTSNFIAEDGGSLYIESTDIVYFGVNSTGYGTINIESTGDGSLVDIYAQSYIYFNGFEQSALAVNISASDGGALIFYSEVEVQFCANTKVEISSGGTLSTTATLFENTSSFSLDATSYWISSTGVATVQTGATLELNGTVYVTTAIDNKTSGAGTITVSKNSSLFVLSKDLQTGEHTYTVISTGTDTITTWHDLTAANFIFDTGKNLGRSAVDVSTDGVVTITDQEESATLIWDGVDGLHEWDLQKSNDWKNGPQNDVFYTGDNVIFNEVAENKDVLINQNLTAGTITVEVSEEADEGTTADYTFDFGDNASLTGDSLSVGEGTTLEVTGNGSLNIKSNDTTEATGDTDIAGDMTVTGGAKANLEDVTVEEGGSLSVEDGSVTLAGNENTETTGDFTVHGSLDVSGGSLTADNLTLSKDENSETGASAEFSGGETTIDGKVTVDSDSTLTVDGGTLNASELEIYSDDNADFSSGNLNIGSLTVESEDKSVTFGDGLTVGAYDENGLTLDDELNINLEGSVGFDTSNGDITIEGTLSDGDDENPGSLTKTGKGTLTLDGENTYTGGTTIDEGTIEADNTDALGTGEVDIHKGATLKIHSSGTSESPDEFDNSTTGEGTLEIVDGDIHFTEDVGVQNVIVDSGATLDGDTTLTHSDASLDLKGTLEISVGNEEVHISDSGTVILEDTSTLVLDDADGLGAGDSFVIVDGGTVTGDIDSFLATDSTLLDLSNDYAVIYDTSNGLSVSIENTGTRSIPNMRLHDGLYSDFINAVITAEDMTIVAGIQGTGDVSSNPIARELLNGNVSRAVEMLNTLAPNDYAAMIAMPTTAYHNDISSLDKRLAAVRAMPFSEDENARWGYFAQADGTFAENDDANDTPTFDFQLYGVLAGADYRMSNTLTVGVALGYDHEHAKLHNSGGRIDGDDVRLTIYAGTQITDLVYANVGAQIGYGHYEARRHTVMGRASGETDGYNAGVFADVGMDLPLSEKHGISARPYVGLAYLRSFVSGFDDSLFDIGSFNNDSLMARVGLGVFWDLGGVSLGIDTSFTHDFCGEEIDDMSATYRATGSKFYMMAECVPEDVFSVGPVVSVGISEGISAFAGYSFQAGSNEYTGHNVYIGVRANF